MSKLKTTSTVLGSPSSARVGLCRPTTERKVALVEIAATP
jgi:hypothetical protein